MKKLAAALAAFALATPAVTVAQIAPPVKRKPVATAPAQPQATVPAPADPAAAAPAASTAPATTSAPTTATAATAPKAQAPLRPNAPRSERDYQIALTNAVQSSDAALNYSLVRVMSRLMAAGKCGEASTVATRDGHKELASLAQQLCK